MPAVQNPHDSDSADRPKVITKPRVGEAQLPRQPESTPIRHIVKTSMTQDYPSAEPGTGKPQVLSAASSLRKITPDMRSSLEMQEQPFISARPRAMDKSTSMNDLSSRLRPNELTARAMHSSRANSLYIGNKSPSSHSLSTQTSPRRLGLGARTVSPTEARRRKIVTTASTRLQPPEKLQKPPVVDSVPGKKTSGIPSPIKVPALSRSRPSPVPPVPPLPNQAMLQPTRQGSPRRSKDIRSVSGPASMSTVASRNRSATLKESNQLNKAARIDDANLTSFTSPIKAATSQIPSTQRKPASNQLQPISLPPLNVQGLSTPTIRRVNDMSQRLKAMNLEAPSSKAEERKASLMDTPSTTVRTESSDIGMKAAPTTVLPPDTTKAPQNEKEFQGRKSSNGFFGRLSLSRASSMRKSRASRGQDEVAEPSDTAGVLADNPSTPKRRLSMSWMKGKMSPFGSYPTIPKYDHSAPPAIPKSFTSESLVSLATKVEPVSKTTTPDKRASRVSVNHKDPRAPLVPIVNSPAVAATVFSEADEEMKKSLIIRKGASFLTKAQTQSQALEARARAVSPVELSQAALLGGSPLNLYEKGEVIDYDGKIYFTGQQGIIKTGGKLEAANKVNFGYDDDRGDYLINPGDHFAYRYEIVDVLGKGSFGQVLRCIDYRSGGLVAIKVIRNKKRFHAQALVEVNILQRLRDWDPQDQHHLIKYTDHFYFRHHLCIATDLLGMNLYEYIKVNDFKGCTLKIIRSFTSQILPCLLLLKRQRVIHCDLKPENILLVNMWESRIKIIDFGSSCFEDQKVYTYIQSRFYRSPEVILGMSYGLPIDMWSMGCILAELYTGYPLFPGEDEQEQLACIMEVFGPPEKHLIENSTRKKLFFDSVGKPRSVISSKGRRRKPSSKTLSQAIKCQDEAFLDFLTRCLRWNPQSRLTPEAAMEHPFITGKPLVHLDDRTPMKKKFFSGASTVMTPRPLPNIPKSAAGQSTRIRTNANSTYRNASGPMMSNDLSPSKHRRTVSNLPLPRDRMVT